VKFRWKHWNTDTDVTDTDAPVNTDDTDTYSTETPMISVQCTLKQWHIGDADFTDISA
jgi:hypothetical protein